MVCSLICRKTFIQPKVDFYKHIQKQQAEPYYKKKNKPHYTFERPHYTKKTSRIYNKQPELDQKTVL